MRNTMALDFTKHPCFNPDVKGKFGRVHLPVAPKCNIQCGYCNRKYDCVNESRPGVTRPLAKASLIITFLSCFKTASKIEKADCSNTLYVT